MVNIAPELYKQIQTEFKNNLANNPLIKNFQRNGNKATQKEVSLYAKELGECASNALTSVLTEDNLPNGKLYWNIAQQTIVPLLEEAYAMVMDAAVMVQQELDKKEGIHLKPIKPKFPKERVESLINKLIDYQEDENGEQI